MKKGITGALWWGLFGLLPLVALPESAQTLVIGGQNGWANLGELSGTMITSQSRPLPALVLSSAKETHLEKADLYLSFDEPGFTDAAGNYAVSLVDTGKAQVMPSVKHSGADRARAGSGAAYFSGQEGGLRITPQPGGQALFSPGRRLDDFSLEFWLYPVTLENGEQIIAWQSTRKNESGTVVSQRFRCLVVRNRIEWSFSEFFVSPDAKKSLPLTLTSRGTLTPHSWSHHLIRFDASLSRLEYLLDGQTESIVYTTTSGREGGEGYQPLIGVAGVLNIGSRFAGLVDEVRISDYCNEKPSLARYPKEGGTAFTKLLDLGTTNASFFGLEAKVSTPANTAVRFFIRTSETPYPWPAEESSWTPLEIGQSLNTPLTGRWAQLRCRLYPDGSGELSPVIEEIRLRYQMDEAPHPPAWITAVAKDGAVELRWKPSADPDLAGYLVYFGRNSAEYLGEAAKSGSSPINVGLKTTFVIDGLDNGALYYFAVAAYDRALPPHIGEFSREVSARPGRTVK